MSNSVKKPDDAGEATVISSTGTFRNRLDQVSEHPPTLILIMGPADEIGKQWPITQNEIIVGRLTTCFVSIEEGSVSKNHAQITLSGNQVTIVDLGSTNGTEVNGIRLEAQKPHILGNESKIRIGNVLFKFLEKGNPEAVAGKVIFDQANLDPLTGIFNKGALLKKLDEVFRRARLTETSLSVIAFDLDNFKKVNDTYGHAAGDYVLKEMARVIKDGQIRQEDFFGRYGGEEFVILLSGSPLKRAVEIAERIRGTIERHPFLFQGQRMPVTISVGVACLEPEMKDPQELYIKADKASYLSKQNGKNRVSAV